MTRISQSTVAPPIDRAKLMADVAATLADPNVTSERVTEFAILADRAAGEACKEAADARAAALDPSLPPDRIDAALATMNKAQLEAERLQNAVARLEAKSEALCSDEATERRREIYAKADREAERVSNLIRTQWPSIQSALTGLLSEIVRANGLVDRANEQRLDDQERLQRPEGRARGFPDAHALTNAPAPIEFDVVRLVATVLPALNAAGGALAWPPGIQRRQFARGSVKISVPTYPVIRSRCSGD
jgi:hypothetical protein